MLRSQHKCCPFREGSLVTIATRAITAKKPDDAIQYLQKNLEYFPKSAPTYAALAQAKMAKGDTQGAITDLETAATLDPRAGRSASSCSESRGSSARASACAIAVRS